MRAEIAVRVQPRASREELLRRDGVLIARVTAPPVDGKVNKAVCKLIAKRAGVAPSRVTIVRGEHARDKVVRVDGAAPEAVRALGSAS